VELELSTGDGSGQVGLVGQPLRRIGAHGRVEHRDAPPPTLLGRPQGGVRIPQDRRGVVRNGRVLGVDHADAHAGRQRQSLGADLDRTAERREEASTSCACRLVTVGPGWREADEQDELVTAQPREEVTRAGRLLEPARRLLQDRVAHAVAEGRVDHAEAVEVDAAAGGGRRRRGRRPPPAAPS
jgi:hypothetical protein